MPVPLLAGVLIAAGSSLLTWIISRIVVLLGIGFITVVGVRPLLNFVTRQIQSLLAVNSPDWLPVMLSAVLAKLMVAGLTSGGSLRKMHFGGGKD